MILKDTLILTDIGCLPPPFNFTSSSVQYSKWLTFILISPCNQSRQFSSSLLKKENRGGKREREREKNKSMAFSSTISSSRIVHSPAALAYQSKLNNNQNNKKIFHCRSFSPLPFISRCFLFCSFAPHCFETMRFDHQLLLYDCCLFIIKKRCVLVLCDSSLNWFEVLELVLNWRSNGVCLCM